MKREKKAIFLPSFIVLAIFLYRDYSINYSGFTDPDKIYYKNEVNVFLSDEKTLVNGMPVRSSTGSVYPSHDVEYYEDKDFYDSGRPYGLGTDEDKHTAEEAAQVTVVNITQPGTYRLHGSMSNGQIRVDLGKSSKTEETAVVNLVLDGVDINCDIAPAIIFKNAYECGSDDINIATRDVDTSAAGANIIIADGSINNLSGSRVAKVLKDMDEEKKLYKYDATITSNISLNINGEPQQSGVLNVNSDFEGITSSLHKYTCIFCTPMRYFFGW